MQLLSLRMAYCSLQSGEDSHIRDPVTNGARGYIADFVDFLDEMNIWMKCTECSLGVVNHLVHFGTVEGWEFEHILWLQHPPLH